MNGSSRTGMGSDYYWSARVWGVPVHQGLWLQVRIHLWLSQRERGTHWEAVGSLLTRGALKNRLEEGLGQQPWAFGQQRLVVSLECH